MADSRFRRHIGRTATRRRPTRRRKLGLEQLEQRLALSGTTFGEQVVIEGPDAKRARFVLAADVDGDGDIDVLSASGGDDKIGWYENIDGNGSFGPQKVITSAADGAKSLFAADLDGDGDIDVLSASRNDDKIAWYENIDGIGSFGPQQVITTDASQAVSVFAADVDGDGDIDVLSASRDDDKIAWYENIDGIGSFGPQQVIATNADSARSVFAADVDGDGDIDVLSASWNDDKIAWYENADGRGSFGPQQVISTDGNEAVSVFAADLDGDGDIDVLSASRKDNKIAWYANIDGNGSFGTEQMVTNDAESPTSVFAADVDGDGDMDVLSASRWDGKIAWYENTDGRGSFGPPQVITTDAFLARSVFAGDVDGDGDFDVLSTSTFSANVAWYQNMDGLGSFGPPQVITTDASWASSVFGADVDGDGDLDVLSASQGDGSGEVAWYENINGRGSFGPQRVITTDVGEAMSVFAADLDEDGDIDVLSASRNDGKIAWYENTDGLGSFGPQQVITTEASGAYSVFAADVDGDGDLDVLSASMSFGIGSIDPKIAWYENTDGSGLFGSQQDISTDANGGTSVFAADLDGDGDVDVLSASRYDTVSWYENIDGDGSFGGQQVITSDVALAKSVFAADLDGDGDIDVLSASQNDNKIAWYENLGPLLGDMDHDNDVDFDDIDDFVLGLSDPVTYEALYGEPNWVHGDLDQDGDMDSDDIVPFVAVLRGAAAAPAAANSTADGAGRFVIDPTVLSPPAEFVARGTVRNPDIGSPNKTFSEDRRKRPEPVLEAVRPSKTLAARSSNAKLPARRAARLRATFSEAAEDAILAQDYNWLVDLRLK